MRLARKRNNKAQHKKRINKKKKSKVNELSNSDVVLNDIMDKEDKEAEVVLNDLVPEKDKAKYGLKTNSNNRRKKGLKFNLNLFPKSNKGNSLNDKSRNKKDFKNEEIMENKKITEEIEETEEDLKVNDSIEKEE